MKANEGVWKKDPRGVEYVSFTMPLEEDMNKDIAGQIAFPFKHDDDRFVVQVTGSRKILGVIVLMSPNEKD